MNSKEAQEKLVENMKKWQKVENAAVNQTAKVMGETDNPLIRLVMEVIQRDSNVHYHVQQVIIDSLERAPLNVGVEDLQKVWSSMERHLEIEQQTIELAKESLASFKGKANLVQRYLLSYLLADEQKHEKLLTDLELIKKGMYP